MLPDLHILDIKYVEAFYMQDLMLLVETIYPISKRGIIYTN